MKMMRVRNVYLSVSRIIGYDLNRMDESPYKLAAGVLIVWMFLIRMYYQERSHAPDAHAREAAPGWERALVASTSLWLLPAGLYIFTGWIDGLSLPLPDLARKIGAVILSFGILLYWWSHAVLSHHLSPYLEVKAHHRLVTSGPYARIRYPIYTAAFLAGLGLALLSANWLLALVYFIPVTVLCDVRAKREERKLLEKFGDEYRRYLERTGRVLPRLFPPR